MKKLMVTTTTLDEQPYELMDLDDELSSFSAPANPITEMDFDPLDKLEDDEWFVIKIDKEDTEMIDRYLDYFSSTADANAVETKIENIISSDEMHILFASDVSDGTSQDCFWQVIRKPNRLKNKNGFIKRGKIIVQREIGDEILYQDSPDAFYLSNNRKLYFKHFSHLKTIFGLQIINFYREANIDDFNQFKGWEKINIDESVELGIRNLKKLAQIIDDVDLNNKKIVDNIVKNATKNPKADFYYDSKSGKFEINNSKQLSVMIDIVLGAYYPNPNDGKLMISKNSKPVQ